MRIGKMEIDEVDLRRFASVLPENMKSDKTGEAAIRDLLQSLVDRSIMVQEAEVQGYDQHPESSARLHRLLVNRLTQQLLQQKVKEIVQVSQEEVEKFFREQHWDKMHRPAHILSATEEDAWEVVKALKQGRDFAELARERSLSRKDGVRGGDLGQYFTREDAATVLYDAVAPLQVGEFTDPIKTQDGYEVVKVLDIYPVPLETVRAKLQRNIYLQKFIRERNRYVESLEKKYDVVYNREGIEALIQASKSSSPLSAVAQALPLVSYADTRSILVGPGSRHLVRRGSPLVTLTDSLKIVKSLRARVVTDSLLMLEAHALGLDQEAEFLDFKKTTYQKLLVKHLRRGAVEGVTVSADEIQQEYAATKERYALPMAVSIIEIFVDSEEKAAEVLDQIHSGVAWVDLVWQYSLRPDARQTDGHFHFDEKVDDPQYQPLLPHALKAELGEPVGPIPLEGGWSIFKVEQRRDGKARSLEEIKHRVEFRIRKRKEYAIFERFIAKLRTQYKDSVYWNDERIEELASSGTW